MSKCVVVSVTFPVEGYRMFIVGSFTGSTILLSTVSVLQCLCFALLHIAYRRIIDQNKLPLRKRRATPTYTYTRALPTQKGGCSIADDQKLPRLVVSQVKPMNRITIS